MNNVEIINERGKMCKFSYDEKNKRVTICFAGFLGTADGAEDFVKQYGDICSKVNKDDTILVLDVRELKPFAQEFVDNLAGLYMDYVTFKKVYWINSINTITNLQTKRLVKDLGIGEKFIFVDSLSDVK